MGTSYSPKKVYETGLKQALAALKANGAEFDGDRILVPLSPIRELPLEEDAPSDAEVSRKNMPVKFSASAALEFDGRGAILFPGDEFCKAFRAFAAAQKDKGFAGEIEVVLDGKKIRTAKFFTEKYRDHRAFIFSERDIPDGRHKLELRLANAKAGFPEFSGYLQVFSNKK